MRITQSTHCSYMCMSVVALSTYILWFLQKQFTICGDFVNCFSKNSSPSSICELNQLLTFYEILKKT